MKRALMPVAITGFLITLAPMTARAVPPAQAQAFLIGYTLRTCDLRALAFTQAVKALKDVDSDQTAGAEVARLSRRAGRLRRAQAGAYRQAAKAMTKLNAPKTLQDWASQTAEGLDADLAYSQDAKELRKTEPDTALVLAELDELQAVKAAANARQPALAAWLKLTGGTIAVWTADLGSYAADLHSPAPPPVGVARRLLQRAPKGASSEVRGDLSELLPRGGGNLQALATIAPTGVSSEKRSRVYEKLLDIYQARPQAEKLDAATGDAND